MTWKGGVWSENEIKKRTIQIFITSYFFLGNNLIHNFHILCVCLPAYQAPTLLPSPLFSMVMKTNEKWKSMRGNGKVLCLPCMKLHTFLLHPPFYSSSRSRVLACSKLLCLKTWAIINDSWKERPRNILIFYSMSRFVLVYKWFSYDFIFRKMWLDRKRSWLIFTKMRCKGTLMQFTMSQNNRAKARDDMLVTFKAFTNHDYDFHGEKSVRLVVSFERDFNFFSFLPPIINH